MQIIADEGRGVVVLFRNPSQKLALDEHAAPETLRQTGIGAQILSSLGLSEITLLTDSPMPKVIGLDAYDVTIVGTQPIHEGA